MTASFPRFALRTVLVLAASCACGVWPVERAWSTQGVVAWGLAFALVAVAACAGFVPMTTEFARRDTANRAQAWLVGLGLRMFVTLGGCLAVWTTRALEPVPFLVGACVAYAVVLATEITSVLRSLASASTSVPATGRPSPAAADVLRAAAAPLAPAVEKS